MNRIYSLSLFLLFHLNCADVLTRDTDTCTIEFIYVDNAGLVSNQYSCSDDLSKQTKDLSPSQAVEWPADKTHQFDFNPMPNDPDNIQNTTNVTNLNVDCNYNEEKVGMLVTGGGEGTLSANASACYHSINKTYLFGELQVVDREYTCPTHTIPVFADSQQTLEPLNDTADYHKELKSYPAVVAAADPMVKNEAIVFTYNETEIFYTKTRSNSSVQQVDSNQDFCGVIQSHDVDYNLWLAIDNYVVFMICGLIFYSASIWALFYCFTAAKIQRKLEKEVREKLDIIKVHDVAQKELQQEKRITRLKGQIILDFEEKQQEKENYIKELRQEKVNCIKKVNEKEEIINMYVAQYAKLENKLHGEKEYYLKEVRESKKQLKEAKIFYNNGNQAMQQQLKEEKINHDTKYQAMQQQLQKNHDSKYQAMQKQLEKEKRSHNNKYQAMQKQLEKDHDKKYKSMQKQLQKDHNNKYQAMRQQLQKDHNKYEAMQKQFEAEKRNCTEQVNDKKEIMKNVEQKNNEYQQLHAKMFKMQQKLVDTFNVQQKLMNDLQEKNDLCLTLQAQKVNRERSDDYNYAIVSGLTQHLRFSVNDKLRWFKGAAVVIIKEDPIWVQLVGSGAIKKNVTKESLLLSPAINKNTMHYINEYNKQLLDAFKLSTIRAVSGEYENGEWRVVAASHDIQKAKILSSTQSMSALWSGCGDFPQWLVIDTKIPKLIRDFELKNYYDDRDSVKDFRLQRSNKLDGFNKNNNGWINVGSYTCKKSKEWQPFNVINEKNAVKSRYWRLVLLNSYGGISRLDYLKLKFMALE